MIRFYNIRIGYLSRSNLLFARQHSEVTNQVCHFLFNEDAGSNRVRNRKRDVGQRRVRSFLCHVL